MALINHLIILAGPSGSGKSTMIAKMQAGKLKGLLEQLNVLNLSACRFVDASDVETLIPSEKIGSDILIVHYDFYMQYWQEGKFKLLDQLVAISNQVSIITLTTPINILLDRNARRILESEHQKIETARDQERQAKRLMWLRKKRMYFSEQEIVCGLYTRGFNVVSKYKTNNHWVLDASRNASELAES